MISDLSSDRVRTTITRGKFLDLPKDMEFLLGPLTGKHRVTFFKTSHRLFSICVTVLGSLYIFSASLQSSDPFYPASTSTLIIGFDRVTE